MVSSMVVKFSSIKNHLHDNCIQLFDHFRHKLGSLICNGSRWMIEFSVLRPSTAYGSPGEEIRLFLPEDRYQAALQSQQRREIKIKRYARVIEGHILDFKPGIRRRS